MRSKLNEKGSVWKKLGIFLLFELIFSLMTGPLLVFYGPFEDVKSTIVGMSWRTLRHQNIAKFFLSDEAIQRIVGTSFAIDPYEQGEELKALTFGKNHNDRIEVLNVEGTGFSGKLMIIYDPTRVKVGYSSKIPYAGETTSAIAKNYGAIAAINAGGFHDDSWSGTGGTPMGFLIHNGKFVSGKLDNKKIRLDTAGFTKDGMLIVGRHSIAQLEKYGINEAVSFGPPLVVNGKGTITSGDGGWGIAPRTAIGQREDGAVLFLVVDGRSLHSLGATLRDVQEIFLQYNAINAVNLDGGSSTTMYLNGKVINKPSDALGERAVPTAFMVVPAAKEGAE